MAQVRFTIQPQVNYTYRTVTWDAPRLGKRTALKGVGGQGLPTVVVENVDPRIHTILVYVKLMNQGQRSNHFVIFRKDPPQININKKKVRFGVERRPDGVFSTPLKFWIKGKFEPEPEEIHRELCLSVKVKDFLTGRVLAQVNSNPIILLKLQQYRPNPMGGAYLAIGAPPPLLPQIPQNDGRVEELEMDLEHVLIRVDQLTEENEGLVADKGAALLRVAELEEQNALKEDMIRRLTAEKQAAIQELNEFKTRMRIMAGPAPDVQNPNPYRPGSPILPRSPNPMGPRRP